MRRCAGWWLALTLCGGPALEAAAPETEPTAAEQAAEVVRPRRPELPRRSPRLAPLGRRRLPDWLVASRGRMAGGRVKFHQAARDADVRRADVRPAESVQTQDAERPAEPVAPPAEVSVEVLPETP